MTKFERLKQARELLEKLTPLQKDCGRYCGGACCEPDDSGENGMLLLPGEEAFYQTASEDFPFKMMPDDTYRKNGIKLICNGVCKRENRPFACRVFPLRIRVEGEECKAEIDPRAWAVCPLAEQAGLRGLSMKFRKAVREAGRLLIEETEIKAAMLEEQNRLDEERHL